MFDAFGRLLILTAWAAWRWVTGAPWSRRPRRRYVQRHVRAAGQWLATVVVIGMCWDWRVTTAVLTAVTVALAVTVVVVRRRRLGRVLPVRRGDGEVIRVQAIVGRPTPDTTTPQLERPIRWSEVAG